MKQKILVTTLFLIMLTMTTVLAAPIPNPIKGDFLDIFQRVTSLIRPVTVMIFFGVFFWGGMLWMTAGPNDDQLKKSQTTMLMALIGMIIIILAPTIVDFVGMIFGVNHILDFGGIQT